MDSVGEGDRLSDSSGACFSTSATKAMEGEISGGEADFDEVGAL